MNRPLAAADTAAAFVHLAAGVIVLYLLASLTVPGDHGPVGAAIVLALAVIGADAILTWPLRRWTNSTATTPKEH
jgi:hypothetical protein